MAQYDREYGKIFIVVERLTDTGSQLESGIIVKPTKYIDELIDERWEQEGVTLVHSRKALHIFPTKKQAEHTYDQIALQIAMKTSNSVVANSK
jgi:hypothetical protein